VALTQKNRLGKPVRKKEEAESPIELGDRP